MQGYPISNIAPPANAFTVVPADGSDLSYHGTSIVVRAIYVGVGGDLKVTFANGDSVVYADVPQGARLSGFFSRVWSTGTTAGALIAEF